ncbi:50S ribosomal protein L18 [Nanohaloarchaea archaeon H01]|nr:50S ribosomal protein L18 [Nanohaloarchaea archaeon H01]
MSDSNYEVPFRRRREQKTDYEQRKNLLKSGKPRAVIRISNNHTRVHLSHYEKDGDFNTAQTVSKELEDYGWEQHTGNIPAAYLTGFLAGMKADSEEAVFDIGLKEVNKNGKMFAALKGLIDAGVEVPAGEEIFPNEERIRGEHIEEMTGKEVPPNFETVKQNIEGEF